MSKFILTILCVLLFSKTYSQDFNGIWQSEGYGFIYEITTNNVDVYDYTSISLVFEDSYNLDEAEFGLDDNFMGTFSLSEGQLVLLTTGGVEIRFNEISSLPDLTPSTNDPQLNFDIFWRTYQEWTAIFDVNDVNWQELYNLYSAQIDENTSDEELFGFMQALLEELNDGHSFIESDDDFFEGGPEIGILWDDLEFEMMDLIEENYIVGGSYLMAGNDNIAYGMLNNTIGYIAVNSFDNFSEDGNELDDNAIFTSAIDEAIQYVQNATSLVLDLRFNYGGFDSNSRILANRFTDVTIPVYSKQARNGDYHSFLSPTEFTIEDEGIQFIGKPIMVLSSGATQSAADVFAMISKEISCINLIGETSYGIFSDGYTKYLPNGWEFGISPERYLDINGVSWEQQGISPDIEVIGSLTDFNNDIDNILNEAINQMPEGCEVAGVSDFNPDSGIRIYPNPAEEFVTVEIESINSIPIKWTIISVDSKIVGRGSSIKDTFVIATNNLQKGVYFFKLHSREGYTIKKIIIQ